MSRRRSTVSLLVSQLDSRIKEKILNLDIDKKKLKKFDELESKAIISKLSDLRDLENKSESDIFKSLNLMFKNKQFFVYCGPLLININPGPHHIEDYLNLEKWIMQNTTIPQSDRKPHLYAFIDHVYESLIRENKDQAVNLLGQIGAGKTFNLVHILEYLCYLHAPEKKQAEFFDVMHKSMQLVHILGSIFRQNNIESSSCGMLIKISFDERNNICNFDLNANILDLTLPFSENGRSFSVLHALITGASPEIKRVLDLPERESSLNFFRKFTKHFDKSTKEKFRLNDYEIWNRFHSLLSTFEFTKMEIIEILQLLSFIILCNEASIGKKRSKFGDDYVLNKGASSKKLSKNFCMSEEEFIKLFGNHKNINETKSTLICLMKYSYYCIFEFVKNKVKNHLNKYFTQFNPKKKKASSQQGQMNNNSFINVSNVNNDAKSNISSNSVSEKVKNIYFIDIPGEVADHTLGGMITNLTNECQNLFAGANYMSVIERISSEQLNMKYFQTLQSHHVIESLIGKDGLLRFLSRPFTEKNFKKLRYKVNRKEHYEKCFKFEENLTKDARYEFSFDFKFSHKNVTYNYESLYLECKNSIMNPKIYKIFENSKNSVIKSQLKYLSETPKNILGYSLKILKNIFEPLQGISPFVIYCLHSNNSLKIFFGKEAQENNIISEHDVTTWEIPLKQTSDILRNGVAIPVLYWEWFGFHEWMDVEFFVEEFCEDFQKVQYNIMRNNSAKNNNTSIRGAVSKFKEINKDEVDLRKLNPFEAADYMLNVLCKPRYFIIGSQHILFRKNVLNETREMLKKVIAVQEQDQLNMLMGNGRVRRGSGIMSSLGTITNRNLNQKASKAAIPQPAKQKITVLNNNGNNLKKNNQIGTNKNNSNSKLINLNAKKNENVFKNSHSKVNQSRSHSLNDTFNRQDTHNRNEQEKEIDNLNNLMDEKNEDIKPKRSMKIQCHLDIINIKSSNKENLGADSIAVLEAKNDLGLNLGIEPKIVNFKIEENHDKTDNDHLSSGLTVKFSLFNFISKQKIKDEYESIDLTHATHLESEYENYKREHNVVIPKNKYFLAIKNLFDHSKIDNYAVFDYSVYLNEVRLIQNNWRAYKSRMLYKVFRYCCHAIVIMQRYIRGWVIRRKFRKFRLAMKCIRKIQLFYRNRHSKRSAAAVKIQSLLRMKMSRIYFLSKLSRKEIGEDSDDEHQKDINNRSTNDYIYQTEYVYEEVEETDEEVENEENKSDENNINNEINMSFSVNNSNNSKILGKEKIEDSKNSDKRSNLKKQINKDLKINKENAKDTKNKGSNSKGKVKIEKEGEKPKKKKKVMKLVKKKKLVPNPKAKGYEKDGQKKILERANHYANIISSGFTEKFLKKKNRKNVENELHNVSMSKIEMRKSMDESSIINKKWYFNNLSLIHELEVDKDKRQILDILMTTTVVKGIDNSLNYLNDEYGIIKKNTMKTPTKKPPSGKRIEDRLIEYGEFVKMKKVGKKLDIMKTEEAQLSFKPQINASKYDNTSFNRSSIIERTTNHHSKKEEMIELLRLKHQPKEDDFDFKPVINPYSTDNKTERNLKNLFDWKDNLVKSREIEIQKKKIEIEQDRKKRNFTPCKISQKIVQKNNYSNFKKNLNRSQDDVIMDENDDVEFDLWPEIQKTYYENKN